MTFLSQNSGYLKRFYIIPVHFNEAIAVRSALLVKNTSGM